MLQLVDCYFDLKKCSDFKNCNGATKKQVKVKSKNVCALYFRSAILSDSFQLTSSVQHKVCLESMSSNDVFVCFFVQNETNRRRLSKQYSHKNVCTYKEIVNSNRSKVEKLK